MNPIFVPKRKIFVFSRQQHLKLRIELLCQASQIPNCTTHRFVEMNAFLDHCRLNFGCIGIAEVTGFERRHFDELLTIHRFARQGHEACLLALVNHSLRSPNRLLQVGFHGVFCHANLSELVAVAKRFWGSVDWPPENATELAISNLPWAPIE